VAPFPWIKVARNDFELQIRDPEPNGLDFEFITNVVISETNSCGIIFHIFYELEPLSVDYWNCNCLPKFWSVGPLFLVESPKVPPEPHGKPTWVQWLDKKREQGNSVLYVAFGSQVEISPAQLKEIATGLEESKVNFLWVIRKSESELLEGFERRVKKEL
jgi:hypothetical protein